MAFKLGDSDDRVLGDINVTPLVDVMLVLLIIFMIAAPMLHQGIAVALPRADARNLPVRSENPLVVSIRKDGMVFLQDAPIHPSQLVARLLPLVQARAGETVFVKGDREVPYGQVVEVLDLLQQGGITEVGMVTESRRRPGSRGGAEG
jgi:biopolymer transport protein TolR